VGVIQLDRKGETGPARLALWRTRTTRAVHVIVPEGFDDPGQPTGGNIYDQRVCAGLAEAGWKVLVATVAAAWPVPGSGVRADLARVVSAIPDGETVLIDGLIASPAAAQLLPHTGRIRMTVLLHMPLATAVDTHHDAGAERSERAVLRAAAGVIVTSEWTRGQVLTRYRIPAHRVHVARPGADRIAAPPLPVRGHLICVGVLSRHKGQDLLVEALADRIARPRPGFRRTPADPYHASRLRPSRPAQRRPDRRGAQPRVHHGRPARRAVALGDLRHDRYRSACPRRARHRYRRRRAARSVRLHP